MLDPEAVKILFASLVSFISGAVLAFIGYRLQLRIQSANIEREKKMKIREDLMAGLNNPTKTIQELRTVNSLLKEGRFYSPEEIELSLFDLIIPKPLVFYVFAPDDPPTPEKFLEITEALCMAPALDAVMFYPIGGQLNLLNGEWKHSTCDDSPNLQHYHIYREINREIVQQLIIQAENLPGLIIFQSLDSNNNYYIETGEIEQDELSALLKKISNNRLGELRELPRYSLRRLLTPVFNMR